MRAENDKNPMGTDGFAFVEFASTDPARMAAILQRMGFWAIARHRRRDIWLYGQGEARVLLNADRGSRAWSLAERLGDGASAIGLRVRDAHAALARARSLGAWEAPAESSPGELAIPAIQGIGGTSIYLIDRWRGKDGAREGSIGDMDFFDADFVSTGVSPRESGAGLFRIDHLTHNVHRGRMGQWKDFYERVFGFREIRHFDIEGKLTGLSSTALVSPCGKIRIPLNESSDDHSQIAEYLRERGDEGIQHIAFATSDILASVDALSRFGIPFQRSLGAYYDMVDARLPGHGVDLAALRSRGVLIDGSTQGSEPRLLLQIFTQNMVGPLFFELIERRGDEGFGEGNFKALFESIELDQVRRGVLNLPRTT